MFRRSCSYDVNVLLHNLHCDLLQYFTFIGKHFFYSLSLSIFLFPSSFLIINPRATAESEGESTHPASVILPMVKCFAFAFPV